jgi:hypothetical protein
MRWASRLAGPATTTATAGPTVSARPVWRIEHRQRRGDQQPAERGAESGGRADRGQQGHAVAAVRGRERMQHQRQGGRHEEGGAERLHHPERDQRARRRRDRAQQRAGGEQPQAEDEDTPAAERVRDPRTRHEERGEHDVVGVQHPRQRRERRARERARDVWERDVHDRRIDVGDGAAQRRDRQHGARRRPAPNRSPRRLSRCGPDRGRADPARTAGHHGDTIVRTSGGGTCARCTRLEFCPYAADATGGKIRANPLRTRIRPGGPTYAAATRTARNPAISVRATDLPSATRS